MSKFEDELRRILAEDPLGLLDVKPASVETRTADDRLVASFLEIHAFVVEHGREPEESRDIRERRLYSRLKGLRDSPDKAAQLAKYDSHGLLVGVKAPEAPMIESIEDVLEHDALGLLDDASAGSSDEIFRITNIPEPRSSPDLVAKRKPCEEFEQFDPLFKQWHADLKSGVRTMVPFGSERQISPGSVLVLQGMLVYVANIGKWEKKNFGKDNARLYCVFENGTESNMLLRSLAAALWKDSASRQVVEATQAHLFSSSAASDDDEATGYIYILRSHSADPRIQSMEHLYKIGFSSNAVDVRTKNAAKEPTYLMADVSPVTTFKTFNLNPQKLEFLVHKFFAQARLDLDVYAENGEKHTPREWFAVPLHIIEAAVKLLISGEILNYRYDAKAQTIVERAAVDSEDAQA